jgi:hypothetical protein
MGEIAESGDRATARNATQDLHRTQGGVMTLRKWWLAGTVAAVLGIAGSARAQQVTGTDPDFPRGRISGYAFGDLYYNVDGDPHHGYNAAGTDSGKAFIDNTAKPIGKDLNGISIRRIYFQADNDLSIKYSTRFRLEADSKSLTSDGKIGVAVKAGYLMAKNVLPRGNFFFGILPTPIFENSEEFWQYRAIEKTIADFRGIGSSADLGVELKGNVDDAHRIGYAAMIGNGLGQKPEDNRYKKLYFSLPLRPVEALRIEPFVDYEAAPAGAERITYKAFAGWEMKRGALGAEVVDRINHIPATPTQEPFGFSVFARSKAISKVAAFARFDRWQPNTRAANRIDSDLYIAGFDWEPYKDVHFMPNIEATNYIARGTAIAPPHHDLQARLTLFYKWSKP